ncbi:hypothetical protein BLNAU_5328 [Blattamonas nauphoetae]|uniref:Uncharacterized protein n=1 Tax=Blattamonas nauphoetae TaxID=2049346 RepID=A0ABQ9Y833_9EUKA|nr:hypothetical protein BLNAU_5328 [Blattamonas nauphoetae]
MERNVELESIESQKNVTTELHLSDLCGRRKWGASLQVDHHRGGKVLRCARKDEIGSDCKQRISNHPVMGWEQKVYQHIRES